MSKVFNMVGGGGGKNISSIIITGLKSTDTVTCTKDGKSYTATWDDTAQYWEIVGLPLGTFTVTATNETDITTETVVIDIAGVYEIEMTFKLWLYKNGDECTYVTGGWSVIKSSTGTMSKQDDGIQINVGPGDETYCNIGIANTIDVTEYSKLTMRTSEVTYLHCSANVGLTLCTGTTPVKTTAYYTRPSASTSTLTISPDDLVVEDISSMTGSYNVVLGCGTGGAYSDSKINYKVYEVWLE